MITIKIGRHSYDITSDDQFMDNGACTQLLTQSKEASERFGFRRPNPILSKLAIKEISKYKRIMVRSVGIAVVFSLDINNRTKEK